MSKTTNESAIYKYITEKMGLNCAAACGILANLEAESGFMPNNLQNSYERALGYNDETYTAAVDSGAYRNFVNDSAGYGLAQWTHWSRKQQLLEFAQKKGTSIADIEMQLEFFAQELKGFSTVWNCLKSVSNTADGAYKAGYTMCYYYEAPASKETSSVTRGNKAKTYFAKYGGKNNTPNDNTPAKEDAAYTVKPGDTLSEIAAQYGTTYQELAKYNGISNPNNIRAGQKIKIHDNGSSRTYTVRKGDTLWGIAKKLLGKGTRYTEIKKINGLKTDIIKVGQVLKIPNK